MPFSEFFVLNADVFRFSQQFEKMVLFYSVVKVQGIISSPGSLLFVKKFLSLFRSINSCFTCPLEPKILRPRDEKKKICSVSKTMAQFTKKNTNVRKIRKQQGTVPYHRYLFSNSDYRIVKTKRPPNLSCKHSCKIFLYHTVRNAGRKQGTNNAKRNLNNRQAMR